ncbi:MAG: Virulence-regulating protein VirS [Candidatus Accumulibacter appositus]|uniref:Virulence-regulating protein VirS n=1 Tax=Candidatus Accumulibacter appositus TaxID=1454003 RepID=A0A011NEH5_9PROT|nr:AraC family transcriptional regulator [Accumulibacter sp.]EXI81058.1 MAG: Virulence-regulating protein VirS [Candidatus Accumulibacter appositus]HRF05710.1 AraC family transcriptional regulator [Accumulibacter sp.]
MEMDRQAQVQSRDLLTTSGQGEIRVGPILAIPLVLSELGVRPLDVFALAGIDQRLFDNPDNRIGIEVLGGLLETCVMLTGCHHFGLLVGERFELQGLGPLGEMLRNSATVGEAIRALLRHFHIHDRGAAPVLLAPDSSHVVLGYSVFQHGLPALVQIQDAAITIGYRILAELCGSSWKTKRVQFLHAPPARADAYHRLFGANVAFEAEVSGIVFAPSWLEKEIEGADATQLERVTGAIRDAEVKGAMGFSERVQGMLPQMLLSNMATAGAVANLLAVHERTLRRRLEDEGTNLQQLINQARFELARQFLQNTALSVSAIASALRYDDPNAFSRAFRSWANCSPSQWRAQH